MKTLPPILVDTARALEEACAAIELLPRVGIDTEFHAERRYRPELMLVQIAADDGRAWVVDPRALDLAPLARALTGRDWVAFAADTDVALLLREGARPGALFDPQLLSGLCGFGWPLGLAALCASVLGVTVDKTDALSDWSRRPLDSAQLGYAADDARLALRLWDALCSGASEQQVGWALQEGAARVEAAATPPDPDRDWKRLRVAPRLDDATRRSLHHLSAWRMSHAEATGQPPWNVVPNGILLDIARRNLTTIEAMRRHRRIAPGLIKRHGAALLDAMEHARADTSPPPPAQSPDRDQRRALLLAWAVVVGPSRGIAPDLLMSEALANDIANTGASALVGWRRQATGEHLDAFLSGRAGMTVDGWRPQLVPIPRDP
jgi:ribonuclease D